MLLCLQVTNQLYKKILYSMSELMSMVNGLSDRSPGAALLLELNIGHSSRPGNNTLQQLSAVQVPAIWEVL